MITYAKLLEMVKLKLKCNYPIPVAVAFEDIDKLLKHSNKIDFYSLTIRLRFHLWE